MVYFGAWDRGKNGAVACVIWTHDFGVDAPMSWST